MKSKLIVYIMVICCLLGITFIFSSSKSKEKQIINNTYEKLSTEEKQEVKDKSKDTSIKKVKLPLDTSRYYIDESFNGKEVYLITFKSKNSDFIGDIEKLVNIETGEIVGYSLRD